jgi:predicted N-formylglutamate amidohydrolase
MQDQQAYERLGGNEAAGIVLLTDHATNIVPVEYDKLGLPEQAFERHIAYDIGVEPLTRRLARELNCPAVLSRFSRLLIDPNRGEDDPTLIMKLSDGMIIPGNYPLSPSEHEKRVATWYRPYHRAVADTIAQVEKASGHAPLVISLHSFTPLWKGVQRPWHAAVLWDSDDRASSLLRQALSADGSLLVGNNEPYDGALKGDTLYRHCLVRGIPHVLLEIRQDLISTDEGVDAWVRQLVPILHSLNQNPALHTYQIHPSRTGPYPHDQTHR